MNDRDRAVTEWARTADFGRPVRWGEVERAVLARPVPPADELAATPRPAGPRRGLLVLVLVLAGLAPVIAVVATVAGTGAADAGTAAGWLRAAQIALIATVVLGLTPLLMWWDTRRRGRWEVPAAAAAAVAGLACVVVLLTSEPATPAGWTPWIAALAALAGGVAVVVLLVASRPDRRLPRQRWQDLDPQQLWQRGVRAVALQEIVARGLVRRQDVDIPGMVEMPLGTWHQLDDPGSGLW